MQALRSNFSVYSDKEGLPLIIKDSALQGFMSVTNDAESVVEYLFTMDLLTKGRQLYYIDSLGQMDEILIGEDKRFIGFRVLDSVRAF